MGAADVTLFEWILGAFGALLILGLWLSDRKDEVYRSLGFAFLGIAFALTLTTQIDMLPRTAFWVGMFVAAVIGAALELWLDGRKVGE